jgi:hypothetical protein
MQLAAWCRYSPATAAIILRASTFDDLYYPFSDNPLNRAQALSFRGAAR